MKIGVVGAGAAGGTLARLLAKLGHQVSVANSRGPESLTAVGDRNRRVARFRCRRRDGRIDAIELGIPDSEWVARQLGRPVIKTFNNLLATSLPENGVPSGTTGRIALPVAGDSADAEATVLCHVDDLGFDSVDGGLLAGSWRQQPGTSAYLRDLGAAAFRRALAEADRSR